MVDIPETALQQAVVPDDIRPRPYPEMGTAIPEEALAQAGPPKAPPGPLTKGKDDTFVERTGKNVATGVLRGLTALPAMPGNLRDTLLMADALVRSNFPGQGGWKDIYKESRGAIGEANRWLADKTGIPAEVPSWLAPFVAPGFNPLSPNSHEMYDQAIAPHLGRYDPEGWGGKLVQGVAEVGTGGAFSGPGAMSAATGTLKAALPAIARDAGVGALAGAGMATGEAVGGMPGAIIGGLAAPGAIPVARTAQRLIAPNPDRLAGEVLYNAVSKSGEDPTAVIKRLQEYEAPIPGATPGAPEIAQSPALSTVREVTNPGSYTPQVGPLQEAARVALSPESTDTGTAMMQAREQALQAQEAAKGRIASAEENLRELPKTVAAQGVKSTDEANRRVASEIAANQQAARARETAVQAETATALQAAEAEITKAKATKMSTGEASTAGVGLFKRRVDALKNDADHAWAAEGLQGTTLHKNASLSPLEQWRNGLTVSARDSTKEIDGRLSNLRRKYENSDNFPYKELQDLRSEWGDAWRAAKDRGKGKLARVYKEGMDAAEGVLENAGMWKYGAANAPEAWQEAVAATRAHKQSLKGLEKLYGTEQVKAKVPAPTAFGKLFNGENAAANYQRLKREAGDELDPLMHEWAIGRLTNGKQSLSAEAVQAWREKNTDLVKAVPGLDERLGTLETALGNRAKTAQTGADNLTTAKDQNRAIAAGMRDWGRKETATQRGIASSANRSAAESTDEVVNALKTQGADAKISAQAAKLFFTNRDRHPETVINEMLGKDRQVNAQAYRDFAALTPEPEKYLSSIRTGLFNRMNEAGGPHQMRQFIQENRRTLNTFFEQPEQRAFLEKLDKSLADVSKVPPGAIGNMDKLRKLTGGTFVDLIVQGFHPHLVERTTAGMVAGAGLEIPMAWAMGPQTSGVATAAGTVAGMAAPWIAHNLAKTTYGETKALTMEAVNRAMADPKVAAELMQKATPGAWSNLSPATRQIVAIFAPVMGVK